MAMPEEVTYKWVIRRWSGGRRKSGKPKWEWAVTIPKKIVDELDLKPGEVVEVTIRKTGVFAPGWPKGGEKDERERTSQS